MYEINIPLIVSTWEKKASQFGENTTLNGREENKSNKLLDT